MHFELSNKKIITLRVLANCIDALIILAFVFAFAFFLGHYILLSMVYGALVALLINTISIFTFPHNYSVGLKLTRLTICGFNGRKLASKKIIWRQALLALYWVPFLNLMLILTNIVAIIIYKNKYLHDFLTKTQVVNTSSALVPVVSNEKS